MEAPSNIQKDNGFSGQNQIYHVIFNTLTFQIHEVHMFKMQYRTLQYIQILGKCTKKFCCRI